jgi:hypothetical protein
MLKISLLDDKSYGLEQIRDIHIGEEYTLEYFETFKKFQESEKYFDIVYLDFYLEKDGLTGLDVLESVQKQCDRVIGFSSVMSKSELLKEAGADQAIKKE